MIKLTIEKTITETYEETQNMIVKRTPTDIKETENTYSSGAKEKVQYIEESQPQKVTKCRDYTITLLEQQFVDDTQFDLNAVIKAVNRIA